MLHKTSLEPTVATVKPVEVEHELQPHLSLLLQEEYNKLYFQTRTP